MKNEKSDGTPNKPKTAGPKLASLIKKTCCGVSFEGGLEYANAKNLVIASNKRLNQALLAKEDGETIKEAFPCWSGTMTGYVEPDKPLGKEIIYTDEYSGYRWIFPVPEAYQNEKNAILVAEHPEYSLQISGKDMLIIAAKVALIERFPAENGYYFGDVKHDIPSGDKEDYNNSNVRFLYRTNQRVGPVARSFYVDEFGGSRGVNLCTTPSMGFGIVVESPNKDSAGEFAPIIPSAERSRCGGSALLDSADAEVITRIEKEVDRLLEVYYNIRYLEDFEIPIEDAYRLMFWKVNPIKYSSQAISQFCDRFNNPTYGDLSKTENDHPRKLGLFLSSLINASSEQEFSIDLEMNLAVWCLGYRNEKRIRVNGSVMTELGRSMRSGEIEISGHAGNFIGYGMEGGKIIVTGKTGDDVGYEMKSGEIHIYGDVGEIGNGWGGEIYHNYRLISGESY